MAKKFLLMLPLVAGLFLSSCGTNNPAPSSQPVDDNGGAGEVVTPSTPLPESEETLTLNAWEEKIFKVIKSNFNLFDNPTSVRVLKVGDHDEEACVVKAQILSQNKFGANVTKTYDLAYDYTPKTWDIYGLIAFDMGVSRVDTVIFELEGVSTAKINKAIKQHFEDLGL